MVHYNHTSDRYANYEDEHQEESQLGRGASQLSKKSHKTVNNDDDGTNGDSEDEKENMELDVRFETASLEEKICKSLYFYIFICQSYYFVYCN